MDTSTQPETFLPPSVEEEWALLVSRLPADLDQSARRYGALRRKRNIPSALVLLRLILAYALGPSLETVARWARRTGLATLSQEALDKRFRHAVPWLAYLVGQLLARALGPCVPGAPFRLRVFDASLIQRPGHTQPDRRLHVGLNLATGCFDFLTVTDHTVGECLALFPLAPGDLALVDRGLMSRAGIAAVVAQQADVLGRIAWKGVPLCTPEGEPVDVLAACRAVAPGTRGELPVATVPTRTLPSVPGRLIISALPPAQAQAARERVQRRARHTRKACRAQTVEAAGYVVLFTTVAAALLSTETVGALYRLRWQVELAFKRLKQLWHLHDLRAQTDALCYLVILANLLLALVAEDLAQDRGLIEATLPPPDDPPPHKPYRLRRSLRDSICQAVGLLAESLAYWLTTAREIVYASFAESPRVRKRQLEAAGELLLCRPELAVC